MNKKKDKRLMIYCVIGLKIQTKTHKEDWIYSSENN